MNKKSNLQQNCSKATFQICFICQDTSYRRTAQYHFSNDESMYYCESSCAMAFLQFLVSSQTTYKLRLNNRAYQVHKHIWHRFSWVKKLFKMNIYKLLEYWKTFPFSLWLLEILFTFFKLIYLL